MGYDPPISLIYTGPLSYYRTTGNGLRPQMLPSTRSIATRGYKIRHRGDIVSTVLYSMGVSYTMYCT